MRIKVFLTRNVNSLKRSLARLCYLENLVQSTICQVIASKVSKVHLLRYLRGEKVQLELRCLLKSKNLQAAWAHYLQTQSGGLQFFKPSIGSFFLINANIVTAWEPQSKIQRSMDVSPAYTSRKIKAEIKVREVKLPLVNHWLWPVTYAMQVMSALLLTDTYTNKLKSTRDRQLGTNSGSNMISSLMTQREIFIFETFFYFFKTF